MRLLRNPATRCADLDSSGGCLGGKVVQKVRNRYSQQGLPRARGLTNIVMLFKIFRTPQNRRNRAALGVSIGRKGAIYWEKRCDLLGEKVRMNMWITWSAFLLVHKLRYWYMDEALHVLLGDKVR